MKIKLELFGASRDFSKKDYLVFEIKEKIIIKDFRKKIIDYLKKLLKVQFFVRRTIILLMILIKLLKIKKLELYHL